MELFIPITKVDAKEGVVYGRAVVEEVDKAAEIFDYESSKPYFKSWSDGFAKATDGKSVGNVRAMHSKIAAGKLTQIAFDDKDKAIDVAAKIVDANERKKLFEGVYTGFSIGGRYVKRWADGDNTRYTADPSEISIVDNPCVPGATFSMVKADGVKEERPFQRKEVQMVTNDQVAARARELAKAAGDESKWADHIEAARTELEKTAAPTESAKTEPVSKAAPATAVSADPPPEFIPTTRNPEPGLEQVWMAKDGTTFINKAEASAHNRAIDAGANDPVAKLTAALAAKKADDKKDDDGKADDKKDAKTAKDDKKDGGKKDDKDTSKPYGDVKYADPGFQDDKKKRYPIDTEQHIRAAWNYISKDKNQKPYTAEQVGKIKDAIIAAWKEKIDKDGPPSADKAYFAGELAKGMYTISSLADLLSQVRNLLTSYTSEQVYEGDTDAAPVLATFKTWLSQGVEVLKQVVEMETAELVETGEDETTSIVELAAKGDLLKAIQTAGDSEVGKALRKVGARNSKDDSDRIQKMHDLSAELGAKCDKSADVKTVGTKAAESDLQKRFDIEHAEVERLTKAINDSVPAIEALQKRVKALEDQPAVDPRMAAKNTTYNVVDKAADGLEAQAEQLAADPEKLAKFMIQVAQRHPQKMGLTRFQK